MIYIKIDQAKQLKLHILLERNRSYKIYNKYLLLVDCYLIKDNISEKSLLLSNNLSNRTAYIKSQIYNSLNEMYYKFKQFNVQKADLNNSIIKFLIKSKQFV